MQSLTEPYILIAGGMVTMFFMVAGFILINVRSQNRLLLQRQALQKAELMHQKELLNAVIESQEVERKRIGRDLHDDVGAALSNLRLIIDMSEPTENANSYYDFITSAKNIIDKVIEDVRGISHNLSPPTLGYFGLAVAVEEHCNIINRLGKLNVVLINHAEQLVSGLELPAATALYRVLEELLNNTIKHAKAGEVRIELEVEEDILIVSYKDNGAGMVLQADGIK
ncbi:MAG: hypothetical protein EOP54_32005, partial [Sphingobacteriales bacterium]